MNEKLKAVNNPLTIIAIFAGLAEIAGTAALAVVDKSLQSTFIWFVMGFPILLVLLFFATLNFNPKVLYAPSDFKNEENFINTVIGTRNLSESLETVTQQLEIAKQQILKQTLEEITTVGDQERAKLIQIVNMQLNGLELRLESVRQEAESVANTASDVAPLQSTREKILQYLINAPEPQSIRQIAEQLNISMNTTHNYLRVLLAKGLVMRDTNKSATVYRATTAGLNIIKNA